MNLKRKYGHQNLGPDTGSTESRADYLACIFELIAKKGYARVMDIANSLSVTEPSASAMITRLAKNEATGTLLAMSHRIAACPIPLKRAAWVVAVEKDSGGIVAETPESMMATPSAAMPATTVPATSAPPVPSAIIPAVIPMPPPRPVVASPAKAEIARVVAVRPASDPRIRF